MGFKKFDLFTYKIPGESKQKMYIDRILYPVTSLGPGNRLCIWVSGCEARCKGCANPELWKQLPEQQITVDKLAGIIKKQLNGKQIDGITISGGEPFNQADEIVNLLEQLNIMGDVLIFSGYLIDEIKKDANKNRLLEKIDVLVDGKYIEELNDGKSGLRGSTNQQIHIINQNVEDKYLAYIKEGRKIQNFVYDYKTISVGIHKNNHNNSEQFKALVTSNVRK